MTTSVPQPRPSMPRREPPPSGAGTEGLLELSRAAGMEDRRRLRWALSGAVILHLALFAFDFPQAAADAVSPPEARRVYVVEAVRFKPPERPPVVVPPVEPTRPMPVPDLTPDDPEPIRPLVDLAPTPAPVLPEIAYIPPPPPPPAEPAPTGPLPVGGEVQAPVRLAGSPPVYTEVARRARVGGTVILRATIDRDGAVTGLEVLKPLPMGLTESAVAAVSRWRFTPGTLNGEPVPVLYVLTVRFELR